MYVGRLGPGYRRVRIDPAEFHKSFIEFLVGVHVGRIQPYDSVVREYLRKQPSILRFGRNSIRYYVHRVCLLLGKLGVAVEYAYVLYLVAPERYPVRIVERI